MDLPKSIVKEFAKQAVEKKPTVDKPTQLVGTVQVEDGQTFVYLDGSNGSKTPVSETVAYQSGDRVLVSIQNRKATIIGNYTDPSINQALDDVIVEYALSSSSVSFIAWPGEKGEWNTIAPEKEDGSYMWQRTTKISTNPLVNPEISLTCIQGSDGENGYTPYIGSNGNWWINGVDTGYSAEGDDGHSPYVDTTTNTWWEWNADIGNYHNTGIVPQGPGVFKSIVFKRFSSQPSTPTGGSYLSPVPSGWSDGIPSGTEQIWISTRVFTSDGESPQTSEWTTPQMASDTPDIDFEYSWIVTNPGNPTDNPDNWSNAATENSIWMAVRKKSIGTWSSWEINKIKGETGADGKTYYTWIKYADSPTSGMSDNPSGKAYIGIAHNKTSATESTTYSDYTWSLIKGETGADGNGITTIKQYYAKTTTFSKPSAESITSTTMPELDNTYRYLWMKEVIAFTKSENQTVITLIAARGANGEMSPEQVAQLNKASQDASDAVNKVDNLEIGGRNLFLNTGETVSNNNYKISEYAPASEALKAGEIYTATICVTPAENVSEIGVFFSLGYIRPVRFYPNRTDKQVISETFTMRYYDGRTPDVNPSYAYAQLYRYPNDGTVTGNTTIHWFKIEKGNKATDWTPAPEDVDAGIKDAAKVATNFMGYDSTNGLIIGNKTSGSWSGYRSQILPTSFNILSESSAVLASYGASTIELGKNAVSSIIKMCSGIARVSARNGGLTNIYSNNGGYQTTLNYDFNESKFKNKVGSNYGSYEFIYSGGVWECSYSGNSAGYVKVNLSDYGITLKTTSINEYAGITINYWNGSEATFINADTTKPSRKLILGLAESGTSDNTDYANIEIERSKESNVEHSKINLLTVHDGANVAGVYLDNGNIELNASGEVLINQYNIVQRLIDMLCCADTESITVKAGTFTDNGCSVILVGNTLYLYFNAKSKAAISAGNITNQTMLTITFTDNRILTLYTTAGTAGASGPNSQMQFNASSSGGQHTITVTLAAIAQNIAKNAVVSTHISMPCVLNWDAY